MKPSILVISGPTASGKSKLATILASKFNGVIINADSMQIYKEIPLITAQPREYELSIVPHMLYGALSVTNICSAGIYIELAHNAIKEVKKKNKLPIIVGGTGLYLKSLIYGLVNITDIQDEVRIKTRDLYQKLGPYQFYDLLKKKDPLAASKINILDQQRLIRAYEVFEQTNESIIDWQNKNTHTRIYDPKEYLQIGLFPERKTLYEKINNRFKKMIEENVLEEVKSLNEVTMDMSLPGRKAHGVPELTSYLQNKITLDQAINKAQQVTRNYAKRQSTWIKNQMKDIHIMNYKEIEEITPNCDNLIKSLNI